MFQTKRKRTNEAAHGQRTSRRLRNPRVRSLLGEFLGVLVKLLLTRGGAEEEFRAVVRARVFSLAFRYVHFAYGVHCHNYHFQRSGTHLQPMKFPTMTALALNCTT